MSSSLASSALSLTVDTTAPSAPSSLTTSSPGNDSTPIITGNAEAGSTVKLYNGSTLLGSATADSNGVFSITAAPEVLAAAIKMKSMFFVAIRQS